MLLFSYIFNKMTYFFLIHLLLSVTKHVVILNPLFIQLFIFVFNKFTLLLAVLQSKQLSLTLYTTFYISHWKTNSNTYPFVSFSKSPPKKKGKKMLNKSCLTGNKSAKIKYLAMYSIC